MFVILLLLLLTEAVIASSVSVALPPDEQFPLIARINSTYSWSLSPSTFVSSTNSSLNYTASPLPGWLTFDSSSRTFHGTPAPEDEGTPRIKITAEDSSTSDTASAWLALCVTPYPPPTVQTSVAAQFSASNPSLSSVFTLSPYSALSSDNPILRIPSKWSFSIGLQGDTFSGTDNVYYAVRQKDGSLLPSWIVFDPKEITLDGVAPPVQKLSTPYTLSLLLHASDQRGFAASSVPFDLVVAEHELSLATGSLPTINVTSSTPFNVSLTSPADFSGVLVDGGPIDLSDVVSVSVDTSQYSTWLNYDEGNRRLTGQPPKDLDGRQGASLPVTLTTTFNQTAHTSVALALVPSYFSQADFNPILVAPGQDVQFNLEQYISNGTNFGQRPDDVNLTASYEPRDAADYLRFDSNSAVLSGTIPADLSTAASNYTHITVTFTAYSRVTHSTSHANLPISLTPSDYKHSQPTTPTHSGRLSAEGRRKLLLGLSIAFGLVGSFAGLAMLIALLRRCARVEDTALVGEEASRAWTEKERQWYGIGSGGAPDPEKGYGYADMRRRSEEDGIQESASGDAMGGGPFERTATGPSKRGYGDLGLGLQRVLTRSTSNIGMLSPGQLSKGEFLGRLKATVRQVSSKYRQPRKSAIGRPILMLSAEDAEMRMNNLGRPSPTPLTGDRSMPRGPRNPSPAYLKGGQHSIHRASKPSLDSIVSLADSIGSHSSTRTHANEAVVQKASRAMSVRSMKSNSGVSYHSQTEESGAGPARPRLVPFTNATRVPVPNLPESIASLEADEAAGRDKSRKRVVSQHVKVVKNAAGGPAPDELAVGMHYVRALGEDQESGPASVLVARSPSGSFSSLESSHRARSSLGSGSGARVGKGDDMLRILVRAGERFRFRLHIKVADGHKAHTLEAKQLNGKPLPAFLYVDLDMNRGGKHKETVKFWGVPLSEDVGEVHLGVYGADGACVGKAVVEVIARGG
ncbi:hypothetical protein DENSPDRAFT_932452 [Dentipellis sp. KUC8613]|nr:hypothetical protein DENSPDRAFT_932452 [Dentipellis sp. KUC8613]